MGINIFVVFVKRSRNILLLQYQIFFYLWYFSIYSILPLSGDIDTKLGAVSTNLQSLSICHWNLNSITTENFIKIPILQTYITINKYDIVCLSETNLDSTFSNDD